jgi:SAM-dependent methyltransferase
MSVAHVRAYYEQNTRLFLRLGFGRRHRSIHRAVWAEGVTSHVEALGYINRLIGATIARYAVPGTRDPVRVLDLGCGVGGTLLTLAGHLPLPIHGLGVSISPTQVRLAHAAAAASRLQPRCQFIEADYRRLPCPAIFDFAVAVEALVHAPDIGHVLAEAAGALKPGGYLLICDDVLTDRRHDQPAHPSAAGWVAAFRRGWRAVGLVSRDTFIGLAQQAHLRLVEARDLTPDLRLLRLPVGIGQVLLRLGRYAPDRWAFIHSLVGGLALQYCLKHGVIAYQWLVLQKTV